MRRVRWIRRELGFCLVVAVMAVSIGYLVLNRGRWGRASGGVATALLLAAAIRGIVPGRRVGMLAVRHRVTDTVVYAVLGAGIVALIIRLHS